MNAKHIDLPAIEGGKPVREDFLPFFRPSIDEADIRSVTDTLQSGWLTVGPKTQLFEERLKQYLGVRNVVAVSSCSAAMFLALKAMGIGPGDEVLTSALTFASTVHAIIHTGATPVLADIETETFGPSPQDLASRSSARTRACIPVHFGGQACRIDEIQDMAESRNLLLLEDAAHGFGAICNGRKIGTIGDATAFSFYATKNLTSAEGGCLATDSDDIARKLKILSYHGMSYGSWDRYSRRGSWYYDIESAGYKFNVSDVLSSLGLSQLQKIDHLLTRRREVAERFSQLLSSSPYFELPRVRSGNTHTWHLFVVLLKSESLAIDRDRFVEALAAENIGCSVHFIPVYKHTFFAPYRKADMQFPLCESYFSRCVSLPIFPGMSDEDVDDVVEAMNRIAVHYTRL
ncbi:MAG: DegT/DnrJ/EryC1/StrS aminotransferase family protein [Candidatus Krumholzibacteria bacterium]|nr:DegT/DnrJ/EryC1/StrS aminotransferase family protein [Candidatus Krumholzibacteria bacterium]